MVQAYSLPPDRLAARDIEAWRALIAKAPEFQNPILGPDFARQVARVRDDVRIGVFCGPDGPIGFLPHHRRPDGLLRPIGAPLSDYHALIADKDFPISIGQAVQMLSGQAFQFTGLIDPHNMRDSTVNSARQGYQIRLERPTDEYLEAIRSESPKKFKNFRRLDSKLGREVGELRVEGGAASPEVFNTLLRWKREQFRRTGGQDVFRPAWIRQLLTNLFDIREGDFRAQTICLYAGETLVAGHFGIRQGDFFHPWIASTNEDLAPYSPGQVYFLRTIAAMPDLGLRIYDLGPSHDHYKRPFCLDEVEIVRGVARPERLASNGNRVADQFWAGQDETSGSITGRIRRRLDAIAVVDQSLTGRVVGFCEALLAQRHRRDSGDQESV
jgi:CelD/BcsL family acetyltransferase involved in cellulose biosynthesis